MDPQVGSGEPPEGVLGSQEREPGRRTSDNQGLSSKGDLYHLPHGRPGKCSQLGAETPKERASCKHKAMDVLGHVPLIRQGLVALGQQSGEPRPTRGRDSGHPSDVISVPTKARKYGGKLNSKGSKALREGN